MEAAIDFVQKKYCVESHDVMHWAIELSMMSYEE